MKTIVIVVAIVVLAIAVVFVYFWFAMGRPLYEPGGLKSNRALVDYQPPPQKDIAENYWDLGDNIKIYHFFQGQGEPVLFIHGGPGYPVDKPLTAFESLTDDYLITYYDQRGTGRSTRPVQKFASSNYVENVRRLNDKLGLATQLADIERIRKIIGLDKLILIGHSYGGFMAALYASEFPENVGAVVLVSPADLVIFPPENDLFASIENYLPPAEKEPFQKFIDDYLDFGGIFSRTEAELREQAAQLALYYMTAETDRSGKIETEFDPGLAGGWMPIAQYFSMGRSHDYSDALKSITVPVLILHGADDIQPRSVSEMYARLIPDAQLEIIENAGHFIFYDNPEEFGDAVGQFLVYVKGV